jgi:hypothetical protein
MANDHIYIHYLVDIIAHHRPRYMHHMTAGWAPMRRAHKQSCLGVWAEVGTVGNWPRTITMWEHDGWDGVAHHLGYPAVGSPQPGEAAAAGAEADHQAWTKTAAELCVGTRGRVLLPTAWTRGLDQLLADGVRGGVYAHERVWTPPGRSGEYLQLVHDLGLSAYQECGLENVGAFDNALINERECFILWAIPDWQAWAAFERAWCSSGALLELQRSSRSIVDRFERRLMTDSALNPMVLGRQPSESDPTPQFL